MVVDLAKFMYYTVVRHDAQYGAERKYGLRINLEEFIYLVQIGRKCTVRHDAQYGASRRT